MKKGGFGLLFFNHHMRRLTSDPRQGTICCSAYPTAPTVFTEENTMTIALTPIISLIAGILILIMPRLLNYIVAGYLIIVGLVGLFGNSGFNLSL